VGFGPWNCFFGPAAPLHYSSAGFGPSNYLIQAISAFTSFKCGLRLSNRAIRDFSTFISIEQRICPLNLYLAINVFTFARNTVAISQFGCRMSNIKVSPQLATLDGLIFVSRVLCRGNVRAYNMKECTGGRIGCLAITGLRPSKSNAAWVEVTAVHAGLSQGTRI
jgi:hypothetical protein